MRIDRFPFLVAAFGAGVWLALRVPALPGRRGLAAWLLLWVFALWIHWRWASGVARPWRLLSAFVIGLAWTLILETFRAPSPLVPELAGRALWLQGRVAGLPRQQGRNWRFVFVVRRSQWEGREVAVPRRVSLSWREPARALVPGARWRLRVRLKPPHGLMNPGGWDYERWLFEQGIGARGYVLSNAGNRWLGDGGPHGIVDRMRLRIRDYLARRIADPELAGIAVALTIGDRSLLTPAQRERLARAGVSHLIAISGLHIGIVAGLFFLLAGLVWRRSERLMLWCPAPLAAAAAGWFGGLAYALLSGFAIPTRRALSMLAVVVGARFGRRVAQPLRTLSLAALLVLLVDPLALSSAGFWLSFGAVALILLALSGRRRGVARTFLRVQLMIGLGLAPLLLLFFGQISLVAPFANLVLIPLFSFVVIPLLLLAMPGAWIDSRLFDGIAGLAEQVLKAAWGFVDWLGGLPLAAWSPGAIHWEGLTPVALGLGLLLMPRGFPGRSLAAAPLLLGLAWPLVKPPEAMSGAFQVDILDVGQGSAVVVRTAHHLLVHDTGPAYPAGRAAAEHSLLPWLRAVGARRIDRLILSHDDKDHTGGARVLAAGVPVREMWFGEPVPDYPGRGRACVAGQRWQWDGVDFEVLWPTAPGFWRGNNASCVVRVDNGRASVLLTGDIEAAAETQLRHYFADRLPVDVLIAPHHGSATSSSPAFVAATHPGLVVFTTGFLNRWGFPRKAVVARWKAAGARTLAVSDSGEIHLAFGRGTTRVGCFRARRRRFWHHGAIPAACGAELSPRSKVE